MEDIQWFDVQYGIYFLGLSETGFFIFLRARSACLTDEMNSILWISLCYYYMPLRHNRSYVQYVTYDKNSLWRDHVKYLLDKTGVFFTDSNVIRGYILIVFWSGEGLRLFHSLCLSLCLSLSQIKQIWNLFLYCSICSDN